METDTDDDAFFQLSMVKLVSIKLPDVGMVKPDLVKDRGISQRAKANAGRRFHKREMEHRIKTKISNLLTQLRDSEVQTCKEAKDEFDIKDEPKGTEVPSDLSDDSGRTRVQVYNRYQERHTQRRAKRIIDEQTHKGKLREEAFPISEYTPNFMKIRAWLNQTNETDKVWAISDGGADATVLGKHAKVIDYSGRKARIIGYDQTAGKSRRVPIVSALIKVMPSTGNIPVLLRVHEAPYLKENPVTLISEFQVRHYGIAIDSTAKYHCTPQGTFGTQGMTLNDVLKIEFLNCGGIMGFEILPFMQGDEGRYEIH
jgi:hypothetical protein